MDENPASFWWKVHKFIPPILLILILLGGFLLIQSKLPKTLPSETHSVVNFDTKGEKIIKQGDVLSGKGIANAKVSISITPNGVRGEATASAEGKWSYTIPKDIKEGNYNLTISLQDRSGNLASIKTYPIKITSNKKGVN